MWEERRNEADSEAEQGKGTGFPVRGGKQQATVAFRSPGCRGAFVQKVALVSPWPQLLTRMPDYLEIARLRMICAVLSL